jgi:predicted enzyme related to lactoylglutathione lyase
MTLAWGKTTLDCVDPERAARFWSALLDLPIRPHHDGWFDVGPATRGGPALNFQPVPAPTAGKTRVHLDIWVDDLQASIARVEALGGRFVSDIDSGLGAIMADTEGTEFCLLAGSPP